MSSSKKKFKTTFHIFIHKKLERTTQTEANWSFHASYFFRDSFDTVLWVRLRACSKSAWVTLADTKESGILHAAGTDLISRVAACFIAAISSGEYCEMSLRMGAIEAWRKWVRGP